MKYMARLLLLFALIPCLFLASCGDDDEPLPPRPTISFDPETVSVERGQSVDVAVTINAQGGVQSLTADGSNVDFTADADGAGATATFNVTAAADEAFGSSTVEFVVTDNRDQETMASLTVNVIGSTIEITEDIDSEVTWEGANTYILRDDIDVIEGGVLNIEAGTSIFVDVAPEENGEGYRLTVDVGGVINAEGTSDAPIVFSSAAELEGTGSPDDWTGLRINGSDGVSSGTLSYVRIEFAGDEGEEEAALRLEDVSSPTQIDHIEIYESGGLGIEVRGGSFDASHIVVTNAADISVEIDDGTDSYSGNWQYVYINSQSIQTKGGRDFEVRDGAEVAMANATILGAGIVPPNDEDDLSAVRIRDDAGGLQFYNFLIAHYSDDGFRFDPVGVDTDLDGDFVLAHSYIFQIADDPTRDDSDPDNLPLPFETDASAYSNVIDKENTPAAAAGIGVGDPTPDAVITSAFDATTLDAFFENAGFVGAFGDMDWTEGWTRQ